VRIGDRRTVTAARAGIVLTTALIVLPALGIAGSRQVRGRFGRPPMRRGTAALSAVPDALDVSVPGPGNARLRGWFLTAAPAPEQGPAALVMHGWGGSALDMAPLAAPLREAGVHTLLLDARGHGRSDGCAITSMPHFAEDVAAGLSWLRAHPLVDPARIVLVGHSVGAGACLLAAHRDPGVAGVVSLSCMAEPRAVMTRLLSGAHLPRAVRWLALRYVEHAIGMRFATFAPLTLLPTLTMPVLLIHGGPPSHRPRRGPRRYRRRGRGQRHRPRVRGPRNPAAASRSALRTGTVDLTAPLWTPFVILRRLNPRSPRNSPL